MLNKIKQFAGITLALFLVIVMFVALLTIWDVIDIDLAKEAIIKVSYTIGVIFIISLAVMYLARPKK